MFARLKGSVPSILITNKYQGFGNDPIPIQFHALTMKWAATKQFLNSGHNLK
jgi:hypothetical protein